MSMGISPAAATIHATNELVRYYLQTATREALEAVAGAALDAAAAACCELGVGDQATDARLARLAECAATYGYVLGWARAERAAAAA